jgi:hypothetical protein
MHVAAQKDLQRTTIYSEDVHEIPLDWLSRLALAELKRYAEGLLQPVQPKPLTLVRQPPRRKVGRCQR